MRRIPARLIGAAAAVGIAAAIAGPAASAGNVLLSTDVFGASLRETPRIMLDPSAENTDVYASVATRAVSTWAPLQNPAGGPYFGKLDPASYTVMIDNNGDGVEDIGYRWDFVNGLSLGTVASSPALNFPQSRDLHDGVGLDLGQGSVPSPTGTVDETPGAGSLSSVVASFAGPRDEPFFVDLSVWD
jgi:hypothetical protein